MRASIGTVLSVGALAAALFAAGCGKPSAPPAQFVGTWIVPMPETGELRPGARPTLTLAPDGTGMFTQYPDPHTQNISWVLRGDKFIMADRDGSGSQTYSYRFNGKDELVLIMEGGQATFKRYTAGKPPAARPAPPAPAPTRGGSARPPARSHR